MMTPAVREPVLPATRSNAATSVAGSCTKLNRSSNLRPGSAANHVCAGQRTAPSAPEGIRTPNLLIRTCWVPRLVPLLVLLLCLSRCGTVRRRPRRRDSTAVRTAVRCEGATQRRSAAVSRLGGDRVRQSWRSYRALRRHQGAGCDADTEARHTGLRTGTGWKVRAGAYGRFDLVDPVPPQRLRHQPLLLCADGLVRGAADLRRVFRVVPVDVLVGTSHEVRKAEGWRTSREVARRPSSVRP